MSKNVRKMLIWIFQSPRQLLQIVSFVQTAQNTKTPHLLSQMTQKGSKSSHSRGYSGNSFYFFTYKMTKTFIDYQNSWRLIFYETFNWCSSNLHLLNKMKQKYLWYSDRWIEPWYSSDAQRHPEHWKIWTMQGQNLCRDRHHTHF